MASRLSLGGPLLPGIMILCCKAGDPVAGECGICLGRQWGLDPTSMFLYHDLEANLGSDSFISHSSCHMLNAPFSIQLSTLTHFIPSSFLVLCHGIVSVLSAPLLHSVTHQASWEMFRGLFNWIEGQFLSSWYECTNKTVGQLVLFKSN